MRLRVCAYVFVCVHVDLPVHVDTRLYVCVYGCMREWVSLCVCLRGYMCIFVRWCTQSLSEAILRLKGISPRRFAGTTDRSIAPQSGE